MMKTDENFHRRVTCRGHTYSGYQTSWWISGSRTVKSGITETRRRL